MIEDYFPYPSYRPCQKDLLQRAYDCASKGDVLLINAPTGSGKSSIVCALLAAAKENGKKVFVGVRTISQLKIFTDELEKIRTTKQPDLKFVSFVGKGTICPALVAGNDPYVFCNVVKRMALLTLVGNTLSEANACKYYMDTYSIASGDKQVLIPRPELVECSNRCASTKTSSSEDVVGCSIAENGKQVCPYEMLMYAARDADVVIVNYNHLLNPDIREAFFYNLGFDPANCYVMFDEAHNLGDAIQSIQSVSVSAKNLKDAYDEIAYAKKTGGINGSNSISLVEYLKQVAARYESSRDSEGIIDSNGFRNGMLNFDEALDEMENICEALKEAAIEGYEYKESACEKIYKFLIGMQRSANSNDFVTVYTKSTYGVSLESRNIDPSGTMIYISKLYASLTLVSGTLSPVEMYGKYYFANQIPIQTTTVPNFFPKENREIYVCSDITSLYSKRNDPKNITAIVDYLTKFTTNTNGSVAVYFPSYAIMNQYIEKLGGQIKYNRIGNKRLFVEPKQSKDANKLLQEFFDLPSQNKYGVMFAVSGGKWSEGLDYTGDILSGAMVLGLPLAQFTPVRRVINEHFKAKFGSEGEYIAYTLPAINRACQALGRVIRTEHDKGILVLGDYRYGLSSVNPGLPTWIKEEARKVKYSDVNFNFNLETA